jgi:hypothetical protein
LGVGLFGVGSATLFTNHESVATFALFMLGLTLALVGASGQIPEGLWAGLAKLLAAWTANVRNQAGPDSERYGATRHLPQGQVPDSDGGSAAPGNRGGG